MNQVAKALKFVVPSALGVFLFFVNVNIGGVSAIPTQHMINWVKALLGPAIPYYALAVVIFGAVLPFATGRFRKSRFDLVFSCLKALGVVTAAMAVFGFGPAFVTDLLPGVWDDIVLFLVLMIPITGIAYIPLIHYGLVEFLANLMQPVMRKIWKTPGESAVDAIVSFASGYSMAMLVTNDFYKKGVYTRREAFIIASGFSTVATGFMVVIANILGLMGSWNLFFFTCLLVTFLVTAITVRLYPTTRIPADYYDGRPAHIHAQEAAAAQPQGGVLPRAWSAATQAAASSAPLTSHLKDYYLRDAIKILGSITASIMSIGLLGLMIAEYTPVFDILGYIFYPFTALVGLPEAMLAAKATAIEIAEMFLCTPLVAAASIQTKFVVAVNSVTAILFFSASIPSMLSMDIDAKLGHILLVWLERTVLSILITGVIAMLAF